MDHLIQGGGDVHGERMDVVPNAPFVGVEHTSKRRPVAHSDLRESVFSPDGHRQVEVILLEVVVRQR